MFTRVLTYLGRPVDDEDFDDEDFDDDDDLYEDEDDTDYQDWIEFETEEFSDNS